MVQLRYEHGRHAEERRAPLPVHGLEHLLGVEALDGDHRPLVRDGVEGAQNAAEAVEERDRNTHPVLRPELHALPNVESVLDDVRVRQLHALRETGRTRGVLHVDDVLGVERGLPIAQILIRDGHSPLQELFEAHDRQARGWFRAHQDDVLEEGQFLYRRLAFFGPGEFGDGVLQDLQKACVLDAFCQEQGGGVRLVQNVLQLVGLVSRVDGDEHGPDLARRELQRHPLGHVLAPHGDVVALLYTQRHERAGAPLDDLSELRVGVAQVPVGVDERFVVGAPFVYEVEQTAYGQAFDVLGTHCFLLVSVPTDVTQSSNRGRARKDVSLRLMVDQDRLMQWVPSLAGITGEGIIHRSSVRRCRGWRRPTPGAQGRRGRCGRPRSPAGYAIRPHRLC
jgi:hypothetical protein